MSPFTIFDAPMATKFSQSGFLEIEIKRNENKLSYSNPHVIRAFLCSSRYWSILVFLVSFETPRN